MIIRNATPEDADTILQLYKDQIGRQFCPWTDHYPARGEIEYDLSRDSLFVMCDEGKIVAAISIDKDEQVEGLSCWSSNLAPGGEVSRLAVHRDYQNQGIARKMIEYTMMVLKERGYNSIHFLVNIYNTKAIRSYEHLKCNKVGECFLYEQPYMCYEKAL